MKNKLEVKGVSKVYGNVKVLSDITFVLENGIYGLIGPNGAGKSTLIRLITTLEKSDGGTVLYNGENVIELKKNFRSKIGFMPQSQKGYDNFSGTHFLYYMATLKGMEKQQADIEINSLVKQVGLEENIHRKIKTYSGGMKQRLMFAQALLNDPKIVILDEPTAGLDPYERIRLRNYISEVAESRIVLLATHVMQDIESIAKEVLLLKDGILLFKGSTTLLIDELEGNIFEKIINESDLQQYQKKYKISRVTRTDLGVCVRCIDTKKHSDWVLANLEDVYLYYMSKS